MAILDAYPGLVTSVTVAKHPLTEYIDAEQTTPTEVNTYIESKSGAEFAVKTVFKKEFPTTYGVEISVKVDGNRGPRFGCAPNELHRGAKNVRGITFSNRGERYRQNYQFVELNVVEEVEGVEGPVDLASLHKEVQLKGCIEVSYRFITDFQLHKSTNPNTANTQPSQDPNRPKPRRKLSTIGAIPEKALKGDARSHQTILGDSKELKQATRQGSTYEHVDRDPFAIVRFHYRSLCKLEPAPDLFLLLMPALAALKALRVIVDEEPEPRTQIERESPRPMKGSANESRPKRKASRMIKGPHAQGEKVKQEGSASGRRIKREHGASRDEEEDDDEITVVETRSCKRFRGEREVIVID